MQADVHLHHWLAILFKFFARRKLYLKHSSLEWTQPSTSCCLVQKTWKRDPIMEPGNVLSILFSSQNSSKYLTFSWESDLVSTNLFSNFPYLVFYIFFNLLCLSHHPAYTFQFMTLLCASYRQKWSHGN